MEITPPNPPDSQQLLVGSGPVPLTADFFRNLIGENTKMVTEKIETLSEDLLTLSRKVDDNREGISKTVAEMSKQAEVIAEQRTLLDRLGERVGALEAGRVLPPAAGSHRSERSDDYLRARRSIRLWPVTGSCDTELWRGAGKFIHTTLNIPEEDMLPDDIESVKAIPDPKFPMGHLKSEILITFFCPRKRDMILSNAPILATLVDASGKPTAGIRLEVPQDLDGTFRLLSRFGTRLRARHRVGTKRHIKFDDDEASMFINIKLPGDESWTRVSPATARADQESSSREESARVLKRITGPNPPALSGPRQRLAAPAIDPLTARSSVLPRSDFGRNEQL